MEEGRGGGRDGGPSQRYAPLNNSVTQRVYKYSTISVSVRCLDHEIEKGRRELTEVAGLNEEGKSNERLCELVKRLQLSGKKLQVLVPLPHLALQVCKREERVCM